MKVTTNTPDLLIVEDRPVWIAIILIVFTLGFCGFGVMALSEREWMGGLLFIVLGLGLGVGFFAIFVRRVMVVFHRPENYVEFRRKNVFRSSRVRHALSEVSHAELEITRNSNGPNTYRVALVIPDGQSQGNHPITLAYSNGPGHQVCKDAINAWLGVETA